MIGYCIWAGVRSTGRRLTRQRDVTNWSRPSRWRSTEERRRVTRVGLVHLTRLDRPEVTAGCLPDQGLANPTCQSLRGTRLIYRRRTSHRIHVEGKVACKFIYRRYCLNVRAFSLLTVWMLTVSSSWRQQPWSPSHVRRAWRRPVTQLHARTCQTCHGVEGVGWRCAIARDDLSTTKYILKS
jgi:hypothetical protein